MILRLKILLGRHFVAWLNHHDLDVAPLLKWRTGHPAKPGWYWVRAPHISPRIQKFYEAAHGMRTEDFYVTWLHGEPRQFAGPLEEPSEGGPSKVRPL